MPIFARRHLTTRSDDRQGDRQYPSPWLCPPLPFLTGCRKSPPAKGDCYLVNYGLSHMFG